MYVSGVAGAEECLLSLSHHTVQSARITFLEKMVPILKVPALETSCVKCEIPPVPRKSHGMLDPTNIVPRLALVDDSCQHMNN